MGFHHLGCGCDIAFENLFYFLMIGYNLMRLYSIGRMSLLLPLFAHRSIELVAFFYLFLAI